VRGLSIVPPSDDDRGRCKIHGGDLPVSTLGTLINALRELFTQMASRLLHERLQRQNGSVKKRGSVPIRSLMAKHIAESAERAGQQQRAAGEESRAASAPASGGFADTGALKGGSEPTRPGVFSDLSQRFARHRSQAKLEPFMAEKMRANTLEHVNKALALARQGNAQGAQIHAELAETAMETAGEYMSDDEYGWLKETVEARLRSMSSSSPT